MIFLKKYIQTFKSLFKFNSFIFLFQALVFTIFFQTFFYGNYKIPSGSMMPTLIPGDRLIVNKSVYGFSFHSLPPFLKFSFLKSNKKFLVQSLPKRGDVIVFAGIKELGEKDFYTKRIIGIPGDEIIILGGKVFLNGEVLNSKFINIETARSYENENYFSVARYSQQIDKKTFDIFIGNEDSLANNAGIFKVPENSYFVMGDNRDNSLDSRFNDVSYIDFSRIVGKVEFIYFSTNERSTNADMKFKEKLKRVFKFL